MRARHRWMSAGLCAAALLTAGLTAATASPASAAGPRFPVMNTSEQPPDGVWFRNSGSNADTDRVTGHGVYAGDIVEQQCYIWGDAVGAYANRLWYFVVNVTRPTVPGSGAPNTGYLNAHFINDGTVANQVVAGVPACGAPPPPPPPPPIGIYADPKSGAQAPHAFRWTSTATRRMYLSEWSTGACDSAGAYTRIRARANGSPIGWMASWSASRWAPLYYLHKATAAERRALKYILFIDPGHYAHLAECGNGTGDGTAGTPFDAGRVLTAWLNENPDARVIVIAGDYTRQDGSSGIQNVLFNDVRNRGVAGVRQRVGVCEYRLGHDPASFRSSEWYIERPITSTTTCPRLEGDNYPLPGSMWHP